jgi:acyl-CoA synthetase (AMP-forming)/AMP-acid ligase II
MPPMSSMCSSRTPMWRRSRSWGRPTPFSGRTWWPSSSCIPGAEADGDTLRAYALAHLAEYKVPRQYRFIDSLPRNATGKVVKAELRRLADVAP